MKLLLKIFAQITHVLMGGRVKDLAIDVGIILVLVLQISLAEIVQKTSHHRLLQLPQHHLFKQVRYFPPPWWQILALLLKDCQPHL